MGYFNMTYYDSLMHSETRRDLNGTSISKEKGTDGKANNTSAYNHDYYMKNKEKWGVDSKYSEYTDDDKDFDEKNYDEKNRLGDTDFYGFQKADGSWVILEEDMKWTLPAGMDKAALIKALEAFDKATEAKRNAGEKYTADDWQKAATDAINGAIKGNSKTSSKEFDVDAAAMDVIRGKYKNGKERKDALGADYEMVQKRVNEMMKNGVGKSGSSSSSSTPAPANTSSTSNTSSTASTGNAWYNQYANRVAEAQEQKAAKEQEKRKDQQK